jgi:Domain of unknown function (DUF1830)
MPQILDPLPSNHDDRLTCCYTNRSSQIQIIRVTNIANWYFERVVFPTQRLLFEAPPEAVLEIHTGMMASSILSDRLPCRELQVDASPTFPSLFVSEAIGEALNERSFYPIADVLQV